MFSKNPLFLKSLLIGWIVWAFCSVVMMILLYLPLLPILGSWVNLSYFFMFNDGSINLGVTVFIYSAIVGWFMGAVLSQLGKLEWVFSLVIVFIGLYVFVIRPCPVVVFKLRAVIIFLAVYNYFFFFSCLSVKTIQAIKRKDVL